MKAIARTAASRMLENSVKGKRAVRMRANTTTECFTPDQGRCDAGAVHFGPDRTHLIYRGGWSYPHDLFTY